MKRFLASTLLVLAALPAFAGTWTNGTQLPKHIIWRPTIKGVYVHAVTFHNPQNCSGASNLYVLDETLDESYKNQLLSILLNANAAQKPIHVWVEGCSGAHPKMTGVQLNP